MEVRPHGRAGEVLTVKGPSRPQSRRLSARPPKMLSSMCSRFSTVSWPAHCLTAPLMSCRDSLWVASGRLALDVSMEAVPLTKVARERKGQPPQDHPHCSLVSEG